MALVGTYHRPSELSEALELLGRPDIHTAPLGGGTVLNGRPASVPEVLVDLQDLDLDRFERDGSRLTIGAMATLQNVIDHEAVPPVLAQLAHRSAPNTIRNMATVGGTVATADWESPFLTGLLAYGATVAIARQGGEESHGLSDLLGNRTLLDRSHNLGHGRCARQSPLGDDRAHRP